MQLEELEIIDKNSGIRDMVWHTFQSLHQQVAVPYILHDKMSTVHYYYVGVHGETEGAAQAQVYVQRGKEFKAQTIFLLAVLITFGWHQKLYLRRHGMPSIETKQDINSVHLISIFYVFEIQLLCSDFIKRFIYI